MAEYKLFGYTIWKDTPAKEIQNLFKKHEQKLDKEKHKMEDDIEQWGTAIIQSITKYVNHQKYLIQREHAKQVRDLNKTFDHFVAELRIYEQNQNTEEVNQLLEKCKKLKFDLGLFETTPQNIPFIAISSKKQVVLDRHDLDVIDNGYEFLDGNKPEENMDIQTILHQNLSFMNDSIRTDDTDDQENGSNDFDHHSNDSHNDQNISDVQNDDLIPKCPICFMIFPPSMSAKERQQHGNEHYSDD